MEKKTIGRREWIGLPDFGIRETEAKVDTGAYTSALHCSIIEEMYRDGKRTLKVSVLDDSHPEYSSQFHYFDAYERKLVRSSNGGLEERYVITSRVRIFGKKWKTKFSLTNREAMKYPVLLGRRFLKYRFVVDVALLHAAGMPQPPKRVKVKKKKSRPGKN